MPQQDVWIEAWHEVYWNPLTAEPHVPKRDPFSSLIAQGGGEVSMHESTAPVPSCKSSQALKGIFISSAHPAWSLLPAGSEPNSQPPPSQPCHTRHQTLWPLPALGRLCIAEGGEGDGCEGLHIISQLKSSAW